MGSGSLCKQVYGVTKFISMRGGEVWTTTSISSMEGENNTSLISFLQCMCIIRFIQIQVMLMLMLH